MLIDHSTHWATVAIQLLTYVKNKYPDTYYFDGYGLTTQNLMSNLAPKQSIFFGPKVLNVVIVGYPYGAKKVGTSWSIDWSTFSPYKQIVKDNYDKWTYNETHFYGDGKIITDALAADPTCGAVLADLMNAVFAKIQDDCAGEMADYGWKWKSTLGSLVGADAFLPAIDDFYSQPA